MIALLGFIVDGLALMGSYVLWGIEMAANAGLAAMAAAYTALMLLLPTMPAAPSFGGTWLGWANWFFPIGQLLTGMSVLISMWTAFLVIRWGLRLVRGL